MAACSDNSSPESSGYESPPAPPISDKLSVSAQQSSSETAEGLSPATGTGTQVSIVNGDPGGKTGKYLFTPNTLSFKKGESVEIDGVKTKISFISDKHEDMYRKGSFKSGRTYQSLFKDTSGNLYKITDIDKTSEFGGGRGSGGGASNTKSTESAQCVYAQAYFDDPKTKFTPEDSKVTNK